ncbi:MULTISPECIES: MbtH family protein [unclassified Streptomyces]|uniref:MbtH family protein n=1 Tax=Streptomyces TaxID=1883 RepID=UPI0001C18F90|nr:MULTISPECIES: MbtH family protein [unclassified Streptomyces]AEN08132.1 MbtH domain protein [Streptomyces sp. SirexAA-E]MYR68365.1 MbtH family NRPS accessory protein [Streptomyces sp. SID4939]MYS02701.1 MbtH family NRPS accessory protein [Streptomyces sp. SID4940]MYT66721.1 MbtH family NRPS accessory protein [Streptomyces sp. SID8357]MYT83642.1 MbtH family NRPS accessory protein [Streptomyces sp. SID8360]
MTNPFDDPRTEHRVLVNDEGQHALWPSFAAVPAGWEEVFGPAGHGACLEYVESNWTDITPRSARVRAA